MIAIDTNLLVYAHRPEMPLHVQARELIESLPERGQLFGLPWPCVHEFLAVVTNGRIFREPTPAPTAFQALQTLIDSGLFRMLGEGSGYLDHLAELAISGQVQGAMIHDARIAALCRQHGVQELWSADRDFTRFPRLRVINPLVSS
jgi:uncharacterized protein